MNLDVNVLKVSTVVAQDAAPDVPIRPSVAEHPCQVIRHDVVRILSDQDHPVDLAIQSVCQFCSQQPDDITLALEFGDFAQACHHNVAISSVSQIP
jgi:hypothetical protein